MTPCSDLSPDVLPQGQTKRSLSDFRNSWPFLSKAIVPIHKPDFVFPSQDAGDLALRLLNQKIAEQIHLTSPWPEKYDFFTHTYGLDSQAQAQGYSGFADFVNRSYFGLIYKLGL